mgnify:CR=1 FL=1
MPKFVAMPVENMNTGDPTINRYLVEKTHVLWIKYSDTTFQLHVILGLSSETRSTPNFDWSSRHIGSMKGILLNGEEKKGY